MTGIFCIAKDRRVNRRVSRLHALNSSPRGFKASPERPRPAILDGIPGFIRSRDVTSAHSIASAKSCPPQRVDQETKKPKPYNLSSFVQGILDTQLHARVGVFMQEKLNHCSACKPNVCEFYNGHGSIP